MGALLMVAADRGLNWTAVQGRGSMNGLGAAHTLQHFCCAGWIFEDSTAISCSVFFSLGVADAFLLQNLV